MCVAISIRPRIGLIFLLRWPVADGLFNDIISSADAWQLVIDSDESSKSEGDIDVELRPTTSARRVKALIEQVTGQPTHSVH